VDQSSQALVLVLALVIAGALLESWWRKVRVRADARAAVKRGLKGERDAEKLLKKLGYTIVAKQAPANYAVLMDGELMPFQLTADFIVEQAGKRLVAEVKTGKAIKLDNAETRRQLLEYQLAFGVESLLLVDMESRLVHTVRFPLPKKSSTAAAAVRRLTMRWAAIAVVAVGLAWFATTLTSPGASAPAHSE
jgi:Holliday junction resolvase